MSISFPRVLAALVTSAALALLSGCGVLSDDAPRNEGGQVTADADTGAMSVRLGDCISDVSKLDGEVATVPVTPCDSPHQGEVYAELEITDSSLPADVSTQANDFCMGEISAFIGGELPEEYTDLSVMFLHPTEQTWILGDRLVQCIVFSEGGQLTGSLKGVGAA